MSDLLPAPLLPDNNKIRAIWPYLPGDSASLVLAQAVQASPRAFGDGHS